MHRNAARAMVSLGVFGMSMVLVALVCTFAWDAFVNGKVYYCNDGGTLDFLIGVGDWVHNPESVAQVVPRAMSEPDEIKDGWSITGLWWLWFAFVVASLAISALFSGMLWRLSSANKPATPNVGIAPQLTMLHHWPSVGEPER
ncbi:MAG: hypothetical protein AB1813_07055 [Verrucomicrobiota bacterium]